MSDCPYGVSPVNYPDPDPEPLKILILFDTRHFSGSIVLRFIQFEINSFLLLDVIKVKKTLALDLEKSHASIS